MADEATQQLLRDWELEFLIPEFEEQAVNYSVLTSLPTSPDYLIRSLVPKIGHQSILRSKIQQHLETIKNQSILEHSVCNIEVYDDIGDCISTIPSDGICTTPSVSSIICAEHTVSSQPRSVADDSVISNIEFGEISEPPKKKTKKSILEGNFNLEKLLNESPVGKAIISLYKEHQTLDSKCQGYLTEIIALHFLSGSFNRLTNEALSEVADEIVKLFPNEVKEAYFTSPVRKRVSRDGKAGVAKGKLVDKYRNKLTFLRNAKILPSRFTLSENDISEPEDPENYSTEAVASHAWLKNNVEPWSEVRRHWGISFNLRRDKQDMHKTVADLYKEWPVLKTELGYTLIDKDFETIYTDEKSSLLYSQWNAFFDKILQMRKSRLQTSDILLLDLLQMTALTEDSKHFLMLMLLPSLVPSKSHLTKKGKGFWKPSIAESREGLIVHVKVASDVEMCIQKKVDKMSKIGLTVQPFIIVLGPSSTIIQKVYVSIDSTLYVMPSVLKAIDICFKSFHVLHAKYPPECDHIWLLLQRGIYAITTKWDSKIPNVSDIISKLKLH